MEGMLQNVLHDSAAVEGLKVKLVCVPFSGLMVYDDTTSPRSRTVSVFLGIAAAPAMGAIVTPTCFAVFNS
jgi:hypothetical protein